jgi:hypothetical protein
LILPVTFLVSLFQDGVNAYQAHDNGGWYNFGFLWGAAIVLPVKRRESSQPVHQRTK